MKNASKKETLRESLIKLSYHVGNLQSCLVPLLTKTASEGIPEKGEEEAPAGKKPKGPPPGWDLFLKEKYEGGKRKVTNPNPKTRQKWPQVTTSTALKEAIFRKKVMQEYSQWAKDNKDKLKGKNSQPVSQPELKVPEKAVKKGIPAPKKIHKDLIVSEQSASALKAIRDHLRDNNIDLDIPDDALELVGASPLTAKEDIVKPSFRVESHRGDAGIQMYIQNRHVSNMIRWIGKDKKGKKYIYNDTLYMKDDAPDGMGARIFASQVAQAAKEGYDRIDCLAFRSGPWVGYKVWPKLGYDGEIPKNLFLFEWPEKFDKAFEKKGFEKPYKVSHLYQVPGGMEWWEENGTSFDATFDLTEGSQSMRILTAYLDKKAKQNNTTVEDWMSKTAKKKDTPKKDNPQEGKKGHEEIPLTPEDHKILDEIWKAKH